MNASGLGDALHAIAQGLLYPVIIILIILIIYSLVSLGSLIVEGVRERKHFKVAMFDLLREIETADMDKMSDVFENSGLLRRQKDMLQALFDNRDLPEEGLWAAAKKALSEEAGRLKFRLGIDEAVAKISPMIGLMGTLIPLGPGIIALGRGETDLLAGSLLLAFDTTVAGLVAAAVCFAISRLRKHWYTTYNQTLEACVTTLLERIRLENEAQ